MRPLPIGLATALALVLISMAARAQESMPVKTVALIKEATAFIRTDIDSEQEGSTMSGSGFLIGSEGTTGYVVTNAHVITFPHKRAVFSTRPTTKVFFRSGTKAETRAVAEVVAVAPERDLAILRVTNVANLPRPIDLRADNEPFETMTVYIFGFPFGKMLALGAGNPPVNVGRGQVSSVRRNPEERIKSILVDGALNPGNSGGPVVDTGGRLVGISVATIRGANIGFAIALPELLDLLKGEVAGVNLTARSLGAGVAELAVEVPLLDPIDKVKSARLLFSTGEAKFTETTRPRAAAAAADKEGADDEQNDDDGPLARMRRNHEPPPIFGPIEGAKSVPLGVSGHRAAGVLKLPGPGADLALWCQVAHVDGSGATVHSRPRRYLVGAGKPGVAAEDAGGPGGLTVWGEVVDPDGDCTLKPEAGDLLGEVPGSLHDLNIDIGKNNAPRVVQEVEGNFVVRVKVTGSFHPGPEGTNAKGSPFNGGGLVVWLDEDHYIRLERGAMYRRNRVLGLLNFESRELGTRAEAHNKGGLNPRQDLWLRLERSGHFFSGFYSTDGHDWEALEPIDVEWPARLQVGLDMINSCADPMTVRFQQYTLKKLGTGKKAPEARR